MEEQNEDSDTTEHGNQSQPFKAGEILRNDSGEFSFTCNYCNVTCSDCQQMIDHINEHFDEGDEIDSSLATPEPEFVNFTITEVDIEPECKPDVGELANKTVGLKLPLAKPDSIRPLKRKYDQVEGTKVTCSKTDTTNVFKLHNRPKLLVRIIDPNTPKPHVQPKPANSPIQSKTVRTGVYVKSYEELYRRARVNIKLTSSQDICQKKEQMNGMARVCYQCNLHPAVEESDPRPHQCRECGVWSESHVEYRAHYAKEHRSKTIKCYQCLLEPEVKNQWDQRRHKCGLCEQWFSNHLDCEAHFKYAHSKNLDKFFDYAEYTCYICEKSVKHRDYLFAHVKCHFDKFLEHQCHLCGVRVRTEGALKTHMTVHDDKTYECDSCDKVFSNEKGLRSHQACHATQLTHVCKVCSKGFKLRKYLRRHMTVHSGVKLSCRFCEATFVWSTGRRAHEKTVHNVV